MVDEWALEIARQLSLEESAALRGVGIIEPTGGGILGAMVARQNILLRALERLDGLELIDAG